MLATGIREPGTVVLATPGDSLLGGQDLLERRNTHYPEGAGHVCVAHGMRAGVARSSSLDYPLEATSRSLQGGVVLCTRSNPFTQPRLQAPEPGGETGGW